MEDKSLLLGRFFLVFDGARRFVYNKTGKHDTNIRMSTNDTNLIKGLT